MMLTEEICARALTLAGDCETTQRQQLRILSAGAAAALTAGFRQEDSDTYREAAATAGSLYVMADFLEMTRTESVSRFTAGDVTVQNENAPVAPDALRQRADRIMEPYRADRFSFRGV